MKLIIGVIVVVAFLVFSLVWMYLMTQGVIPESIGLGLSVNSTVLLVLLVAFAVILGILLIKGKNKPKA